jgi:methanogenic corrinoid protein MtbC1
LLNNHGIKISRIAEFTHEQLIQKVLDFSEKKTESDIYINQMIVCMIDLDEEMFEHALSKLQQKIGMESTITDVIYPFLDRIGILWQTGNITPAQEHFISNLVRQKLIVAIDSLPYPAKTGKTAMLFLPEYELHEIGLLFCHYVLKKAGVRVIYLGQMVPYNDLKSISMAHNPDLFVTSIIAERSPRELQEFFNMLSRDFPSTQVIATGGGVARIALKFPPNFHVSTGISNLLNFV